MANALLLRTCQRRLRGSDRTTISTQHECANCQKSPCDEANKKVTLGALIYGMDPWEEQAPEELLALEKENGRDVITKMFDKALHEGSFSSPSLGVLSLRSLTEGNISYHERYHTYLPSYEPLSIIPVDAKTKTRLKRPLHHCRIGDDLNVYSVMPNFPSNSYGSSAQ